MKRLAALLIVLCMLLSAAGATAGNEQVQGEIVIYSSMYQFVLDMLDEALKKEFPPLTLRRESGIPGRLTAGEMSGERLPYSASNSVSESSFGRIAKNFTASSFVARPL